MLVVFCMVATLLAAALTVPAGFGLATMLTPVMLLWLDPHLAIAAVAVVHAAHNGWKLLLLKTDVDFAAVKRYGWAMVLGAFIGDSQIDVLTAVKRGAHGLDLIIFVEIL